MKLEQLSVREFITELSSGNPTPGGGSVAALCGALGAALSAMVANLTVEREKYEQTWNSMDEVKKTAANLSARFLELMQEDSDTYQKVITAFELPKETDDQNASRQEAIEEAMKKAAAVPLDTLRASEELIRAAGDAVRGGNPNAITDAAAAVQLANTTAVVASYNVQINISRIKDQAFVERCEKEVTEILKRQDALISDVDGNTNIYLA
ncbi:MAG TPA: cyclodeaminase/cyclohydrolase family protein [Desulfatiglandales bacterium]|nr:cyclodeaminase/cyclohydrolase family protein [Desulfatiglandales bacterium]